MKAIAKRDAARAELQDVRAERDEVIRLAEDDGMEVDAKAEPEEEEEVEPFEDDHDDDASNINNNHSKA